MKTLDSFEGHRVLILAGAHAGEEGICLGRAADGRRWAVSPDSSDAILDLVFADDFALLLDLSPNPAGPRPPSD
jgi:hypothetical protein